MTALEPIRLWIIILGGMLVTYAMRLSFIALVPHDRMPVFFRRLLRYVPPSVLAALILPNLLVQNAKLALSLNNTRLLAGIFAALVAWRTRNTWLTIGAGMGVLWLLTAIV